MSFLLAFWFLVHYFMYMLNNGNEQRSTSSVNSCTFYFHRFGTRSVYLVSAMANILSGLACAAAPNITSFLVIRFLHGNFVSGKESCNFVQGTYYRFITEY